MPNLGDQSGGPTWVTNLEDQSGRDRESVNELMDASATLCELLSECASADQD